MPSTSLENQISHSILLPKDKIYHVPPKVFGCVCFVHDVFPDIFIFKNDTNVTLNLQKDTIFFEEIMFFTKDDYDSIQQALPIPYLSPKKILQPSSSIHSQVELSSPSMSTCQSKTQEMGNLVCEDSLDSCPLSSTDPTPDPLSSSHSHDSDIGWPIALRKGILSTCNPHPYHRLSPPYFSFVSSVSSITIPKYVCKELNHPGWRQAMIVEMQALEQSVPLPSSKKAIGCRWVFAIKVAPNNTVDRLKARLVAKGYTQIYGFDYGDTFSPMAKITTIPFLLAMTVIRQASSSIRH
ncbi:putative mitochondrial protein, partial [Mucuna pruriens]